MGNGVDDDNVCLHALPSLNVVAASYQGHKIQTQRYPAVEASPVRKIYSGHSGSISSMRFSHNRRHLVTVSGEDRTILLWRQELAEDSGSSDEEDEGGDKKGSYFERSIHINKQISQLPLRLSNFFSLAEVNSAHPRPRKVIPTPLPTNDVPATSSTGISDVNLHLAWVHGFRGADCRANVHQAASGALVYPAATIVLSLNRSTQKQRFLSGAHQRDVSCITMHPNGQTFASGDTESQLFVWSEKEMTIVFHTNTGQRGILNLTFSLKGDLLASLGSDHTILVTDWRLGLALISAPCLSPVYCLEFMVPEADSSVETIVIGGGFGLRLLDLYSCNYTLQNGLFGEFEKEIILCVNATMQPSLCITGCLSGALLLWSGHTVIASAKLDMDPLNSLGNGSEYPHVSAITSIFGSKGAVVDFVADNASKSIPPPHCDYDEYEKSARCITGDSSGRICFWRFVHDVLRSSPRLMLVKRLLLSELRPKQSPTLACCIQSLSVCGEVLVVGLVTCEIIEVNLRSALISTNGKASSLSSPSSPPSIPTAVVLVQPHIGTGAVGGIASHPSLPVFFSASSLQGICCWSLATHSLISYITIPVTCPISLFSA